MHPHVSALAYNTHVCIVSLFLCAGDFHIATIRNASVTTSLALPVCQLLCLSPSAVVVVVVGGGAASRPSQIKEHKGDCCGSSCEWVLSPGRPDSPASHGAGSSCVLCVFPHGQYSNTHQQKARKAHFPYFWTSFFKCHSSVLFYLHSVLSDSISISFSCLLICFATERLFLPPCPWLGSPSLSVVIHHLSSCILLKRVFLGSIMNR